jgi:hypothetical protein
MSDVVSGPAARAPRLQSLTLVLRVTMEVGIIAALAYWGVQTGAATPTKALLGIAAPLVGFGIWGLVDFRGSGALAEPLRLGEELVISGAAALAAYTAGAQTLGWLLGVLSIVYHALVYVAGDRLLRTDARRAQR